MTDPKCTDIFFVEDNEVIRFCLRVFLKKIPELNVVGEAADGETAIEKVRELKPSIALVDIGLPDIDGIELTKRLKAMLPELRVLILTASENEDDVFNALEAGADGYVLKGEFSENLEVAIKSVRVGAVWLDPGIARQVLRFTQQKRSSPQVSQLSAEEHQVLTGVAESSCTDGVCLVDPAFLHKLKRFSTSRQLTQIPFPTMSTESQS